MKLTHLLSEAEHRVVFGRLILTIQKVYIDVLGFYLVSISNVKIFWDNLENKYIDSY